MYISQDMLCHVNAPVIFPPPSLNGGQQEPITPGGYPGKTESFHLVFTRFRFPGSWEIHLFSRPRYTMRGLSVSLSRLFPVSNVPAFYEQFKFWPRSSDLKKGVAASYAGQAEVYNISTGQHQSSPGLLGKTTNTLFIRISTQPRISAHLE